MLFRQNVRQIITAVSELSVAFVLTGSRNRQRHHQICQEHHQHRDQQRYGQPRIFGFCFLDCCQINFVDLMFALTNTRWCLQNEERLSQGGTFMENIQQRLVRNFFISGCFLCFCLTSVAVSRQALDFLAIAVHELASISERRIERLCNPSLSELPAFLVNEGGLNSGFMIAHCTAASLGRCRRREDRHKLLSVCGVHAVLFQCQKTKFYVIRLPWIRCPQVQPRRTTCQWGGGLRGRL